MANRMDLSPGGMIYFGGHYDPEKLKGYIAELTQLTSICKWAEETMGVLWPVIKALPRDPIADSAHSADPPSA